MNKIPGVHIDKLTKDISIDIDKKPAGAVQWDFLNDASIKESIMKKYSKGPEAVFLFLTNTCSELCEVCSKKEIVKMERNFLKQILYQLEKTSVRYVVIDGEPLNHPDLFMALEFLHSKGIQVSINIGKEADVKTIKKLQNHGVKKIQVRLKGLEKDYENSERFFRLRKTLVSCKKAGEYSSVIFSINKHNFTDIKKFIGFCEEIGVGQFSFIRLSDCVFSSIDKKDALVSQEFKDVSKKLIQLRREEQDKIHITSNEAIWKGCGAAFISCAIFPKGDVTPCIYITKDTINLKDTTLEDIWHTQYFKSLRESTHLKGKCGRCSYNVFCKGCRAFAYQVTGELENEDPGCWLLY